MVYSGSYSTAEITHQALTLLVLLPTWRWHNGLLEGAQEEQEGETEGEKRVHVPQGEEIQSRLLKLKS